MAAACGADAVSRLQHELVLKTTFEVVSALRSAGIEHAVLKGPVLAARIYEDPARRESCDVDVLVRRRDLGGAIAVVAGSGYEQDRNELMSDADHERFGLHTVMVRSGRPAVELHFRVMPWSGPCGDGDELVERRVAATVRGRVVDVLAPEDEFVFLCAHAARHRFEGDKWLEDIGLFAVCVDLQWARVRQIAESLSLRTCVWLALRRLGSSRVEEFASGGITRRALWPEGELRCGSWLRKRLRSVVYDSLYTAALCDGARAVFVELARGAVVKTKRDWRRLLRRVPAWRPTNCQNLG